MAEEKNQSLTKVSELRPLAEGLNLTVKVISTKTVIPRGGRPMKLSECLVGDETGIIVCTARNDQVEKMKEGKTVTLYNARVDMFKGSMRLAVDRFGKIEVLAQPADFKVKEDSNLSLIEFERVEVVV